MSIAHLYLDRGADGAAARPLRYDETRLAVRFGRLHALSGAERARPFSRGFRRASAGQTSGGAGRIDRKSVVQGKSVSVRVDLGGRRIIKKKKNTTREDEERCK